MDRAIPDGPPSPEDDPRRHHLVVRRGAVDRIDVLSANHRRIGLDGLLAGAAGRGSAARRTRVPAAAAVEGFRWNRRDDRDADWWPQGIDVRVLPGGARLLAVSWYARPRPGGPRGARVSFVHLRPGRRPRYRHVLLVEARPDAEGDVPGFRPVETHAGGLAWHGDRLWAASTFDGVRVFDVRDILDASRPGFLGFGRRSAAPGSAAAMAGAVAILPQAEHWAPPEGAERMRYSFLSVDRRADAEAFVAGEYSRDDPTGRLVELSREAEGARTRHGEALVPGLTRMQGATPVDHRWFVTASAGSANGDLWVGAPGAMTRHAGVLPPGPEDLALEPGSRILWSLSEHPRRRWVFSIDADAWPG